jgi:hypothetical protein
MNKKKIMSAIEALAAGVKGNAKSIKENQQAISKLTQRFEVLNEHSDYLERLTTELSHALPDPEHEARCKNAADEVSESLNRHAFRLGLRKPRPPLINSLSRHSTRLSLTEQQPALRGSDLCRAMLERGDDWVVCKVADTSESDAIKNSRPRMITHFDDDDGFYQEDADMFWAYAVPVDMNGNEITQLPDADPRPGDVLLRQDPHKYFDEGARYIVTDDLRVRDVQGDKWPFLRKNKDLYVFGLDDAITACFIKAKDAAHG